MEGSFTSISISVITLIINSFILWSTHWIPQGNTKKEIRHWVDALWIGIAQGISILPGISRSGATISTALWLNVKSEDATRFSFFLAIPAILGATVFILPESLSVVSPNMWTALTAGFIAAFVSGYFAISVLFKIVSKGRFHYFAIYTFALAIVAFLFSSSR